MKNRPEFIVPGDNHRLDSADFIYFGCEEEPLTREEKKDYIRCLRKLEAQERCLFGRPSISILRAIAILKTGSATSASRRYRDRVVVNPTQRKSYEFSAPVATDICQVRQDLENMKFGSQGV